MYTCKNERKTRMKRCKTQRGITMSELMCVQFLFASKLGFMVVWHSETAQVNMLGEK